VLPDVGMLFARACARVSMERPGVRHSTASGSDCHFRARPGVRRLPRAAVTLILASSSGGTMIRPASASEWTASPPRSEPFESLAAWGGHASGAQDLECVAFPRRACGGIEVPVLDVAYRRPALEAAGALRPADAGSGR